MATGSDQTRLIVLRGNSGCGKSTVARALREAYGRGIALVHQDLIRRVILRERDRPGAANIGLIDQVARFSLDNSYHVVVEGILYADRYEQMLAGLSRDHRGRTCFYYLDVSVEETLRRHLTRPQASEFSQDDMRGWYRPHDLLSSVREHVIPQTSSLQQTVELILADTQLLQAAVLKAEPAGQADLVSWLELAAEAEPLFGPMPDFGMHAERAIRRGTALVVRDRSEVVLGAALLSARSGERHIQWLAVRSGARRRGVARALLTEIIRRWPPPGRIDVVTFGPDVPAGAPARALYQSFGFSPAEMLPAGADGISRQHMVLRTGR